MGADASKTGERAVSQDRGKRGPSDWGTRKLPVQLFAVIRHAERADDVFALVGGKRWTQTEDFLKHPVDPPLSDVGIAAARQAGKFIQQYGEEVQAPVHIVVCSPYFRCVQTAVEICSELQPTCRILVDLSLGEIYGPSVMGKEEPAHPLRSAQQVLQYAQAKGVSCRSKVIGQFPSWPEDSRAARIRFAVRFLTYLHRSTKVRRNFIMVTHADCVAAALTMIPSEAGYVVSKVENGGMFVGSRQLDIDDNDDARSEADTRSEAGDENTWCDKDVVGSPGYSGPSDDTVEAADEGWQVKTQGITLQRRDDGRHSLDKQIRKLEKHSRFSHKHIGELLGHLNENAFSDMGATKLEGDIKKQGSRLIE